MSKSIAVTPLSPYLGAEVRGVDLCKPLDDSVKSGLRDALYAHSVLLFRAGRLDVSDQARLVQVFYPLFDELEDGSNYYYFDDARLGTSGDMNSMSASNVKPNLHADFMWTPYPLPVISLYAEACTEASGPTRFSNSARAAARLTADQRERFSALKVRHARYDVAESADAVHPMIVSHPRTGVPLLYVSEIFTKSVEGVSEVESQGILDEAFQILREADNLLDVHYETGDLVIWDNLSMVHGRVSSENDEAPRILRRVCGSEKTFAEMLPEKAARMSYCTSLSRHIRPGDPATAIASNAR